MKPKLTRFRFVLCFTSECCEFPHLWGETVHARTLEQAKRKAIKTVSENGLRTVHEMIHVTNGLGTVEDVATIQAHEDSES